MRFLAVILLAGLLIVSVVESAPARPLESLPAIDQLEEDCRQIPPEAMPPLALSRTETLDLEVRVLFERGDRATVKTHMRTTAAAFDHIGVRLAVTYDRIDVPKQWKEPNGLFPDDVGSSDHFELMKDHYGGERPPGVDIVYFFSRYWGGGLADCIGGVRFPDRAFAFGSLDYAFEGIVPIPTVDEGVIAAHEIGHLLGAHHHYSNCSEAPVLGALAGEVAVCTTMSPAAATASAFFGLLETSFVRYFTKEYAQAGT